MGDILCSLEHGWKYLILQMLLLYLVGFLETVAEESDSVSLDVCIKCIQKHMGNEEEGKKRAKPQTNRMPYLQYLYIAFVKNRSSSVCQKLGLGLKKMKPAG